MPRIEIRGLRIARITDTYTLGESRNNGPEHRRFYVAYRVRLRAKGDRPRYDSRRGIEGPIKGMRPTRRERFAIESRALQLLAVSLWEALKWRLNPPAPKEYADIIDKLNENIEGGPK